MSKVKYDSENRTILAQRVLDNMNKTVEIYQFIFNVLLEDFEKDETHFHGTWEKEFGEEDANIG